LLKVLEEHVVGKLEVAMLSLMASFGTEKNFAGGRVRFLETGEFLDDGPSFEMGMEMKSLYFGWEMCLDHPVRILIEAS
jgi:hypothetical protein